MFRTPRCLASSPARDEPARKPRFPFLLAFIRQNQVSQPEPGIS